MYVARHQALPNQEVSAKANHGNVCKAVDEQGSILIKLQDIRSRGEGKLPITTVDTDTVLARTRYVPTADETELEDIKRANKYLAARFLGE